MAEFTVHSARFYEFKPLAIHCMCYNRSQGKLALSRSDNSVEIWDLRTTVYQEKIIPGSKSRSVEALAWCGKRLFSTGLQADITEYDLFKLCPKSSVYLVPSACWCMVLNKAGTHLAIGTEEGHICLIDVTQEELQYERELNRRDGRVICLAWHESGDYLVSGCVDVLRILDVKTGQVTQQILVGRSDRNLEVVIWCVAFTRDFQIISGDSRGIVSFWNGKLGTQLECFKSHLADVLTLCIDEAERKVYASGIDPWVVGFEPVTKHLDGRKTWVRTQIRHPHTHDVRAMTFAGPHLVSGGLDTYLNVAPILNPDFDRYYHSAIPQSSVVDVATATNLVLFRYPQYLELWALGSEERSSELAFGLRKVLQLNAKSEETIVCSAISANAEWLAYSTIKQLRLFQIITEARECLDLKVSLNRVKFKFGPCHRMTFTSDLTRLIVATENGTIDVIAVDPAEPKILHTLTPPAAVKDCIHLLAASCDGVYIASADHLSNISVFDTRNGKLHCTLPRNDCQPSAMAFNPKTSVLVVAYTDKKLIEFDIYGMKFSSWTQGIRNSDWLPKSFHPVLNVGFSAHLGDVIILHDENRICVVNKKQVLNSQLHSGRKEVGGSLKRSFRRNARSISTYGCHVSEKYKHLVHFSCLKGFREALAIEVSDIPLFEALPNMFKRKKFGT